MLERDLEKKLVAMVKAMGGVAYKLDSRSHKGAPDRVIKVPGMARATFVELKTDTGRLSPLQTVELERIMAAGGNTRVIYGVNELVTWLESFK